MQLLQVVAAAVTVIRRTPHRWAHEIGDLVALICVVALIVAASALLVIAPLRSASHAVSSVGKLPLDAPGDHSPRGSDSARRTLVDKDYADNTSLLHPEVASSASSGSSRVAPSPAQPLVQVKSVETVPAAVAAQPQHAIVARAPPVLEYAERRERRSSGSGTAVPTVQRARGGSQTAASQPERTSARGGRVSTSAQVQAQSAQRSRSHSRSKNGARALTADDPPPPPAATTAARRTRDSAAEGSAVRSGSQRAASVHSGWSSGVGAYLRDAEQFGAVGREPAHSQGSSRHDAEAVAPAVGGQEMSALVARASRHMQAPSGARDAEPAYGSARRRSGSANGD